MPILKEPQRYTVCTTCEEVIEYDPSVGKDVIQIVHEKCGKVVSRYDGRGVEYQALLEMGAGHTIAWEIVFQVPSLSPQTRLSIIAEREKIREPKPQKRRPPAPEPPGPEPAGPEPPDRGAPPPTMAPPAKQQALPPQHSKQESFL